MTRIDFYFNAESRLQFASRIAVKALHNKLRITIFCQDETLIRAVDKLLWSHPSTAFIPHCAGIDKLAHETPIVLVENTDCPLHLDVLINLDQDPPPRFERFQRLIEIVSRDDKSDQENARKRFRFYKDRGYAMAHHNLETLAKGTSNG